MIPLWVSGQVCAGSVSEGEPEPSLTLQARTDDRCEGARFPSLTLRARNSDIAPCRPNRHRVCSSLLNWRPGWTARLCSVGIRGRPMSSDPLTVSLDTLIAVAPMLGYPLEDRSRVRDAQDPALVAAFQKASIRPLHDH